jgi:hypothetical protein
MVAAVFTLASSGMAQGTKKHGMMQGTMKHDMTAMPSLAGMLQRADSLVGRTEKMMRATADTTAHAMMMRTTADTSAHARMTDHTASDAPQAMASSLHAMATGLRGVLQHMDAMHRAGMKMEGDAGTAMMDVHRRMNTMLGELEKTLLAKDQMHAHHAKSSP